MTPETRTSLTTTAFVTVAVVVVAALSIAYVDRRPGGQGSKGIVAGSCDDLTSGTYWALEFNNDAGSPGNPAYGLATIDLSAARGGFKHNVEVSWITPPYSGSPNASETTFDYDFNPATNCTDNRMTMLFQPEGAAPALSVTFTGGGSIAAHGGNPSANWKGAITQIP